MTPINRRFVSSILLIGALVLNLLNVNIAFADDGTPPPPPTEEATQPPIEPTETPVVEETPVPTETPISSEETADVEDQASAEEDVAASEILSELPENTEIVVLDESGNPIPLASQEAADAVMEDDPMWCPAGTPPGAASCRNFTGVSGITNLLTDMRNNTSLYDENGVIYFTSSPGNGSFNLTTAGTSLGTGDFNTLKVFDITLQGGWNGVNGVGATFTGQTNFGSNSITVGQSGNPWVGNVTLNNFTFSGVSSSNAATVYTTNGDITLNNVDVAQQSGANYTAFLDSNTGDITVQNGSSFDGNNTGNNQNRGFSADTNSGTITTSDTTFSDARGCGALFGFCIFDQLVNYNGATLSAPTVALTNVTANNNDLSGIQINNASQVTLNNIISTNNGTFFLVVGLGSGVSVNGTGSTIVNVTGGTLTNNEAYGLSVFNGSIVAVTNPTCNGNTYPGPDPSTCYNIKPVDTIPPVLTLPANMTIPPTGPSGAVATYSASALDAVDGIRPVTCSPGSASLFPVGTTTVTCTASDTSGNTGSGTFTVTVTVYIPPASIRNPLTETTSIILVTGGELIDLECASVVNAFGVIVKFHNLCDHQAVLNELGADSLPGTLPAGYAFIKGLDVDVLGNGQLLDVLPNHAGVEMDFPLPAGTEFAVLFWNDGQWVEITQIMDDSELETTLSSDAANEFYLMSSSNAAVHKILTTEKTGTFVLVMK
jgi:hypothetical protein